MGEKGLFTSDANLAGVFSHESALLRNDQDTPNFPASTSPPEGFSTPHTMWHRHHLKKIWPLVFNNPPALFRVLPLIRAPLPSLISQTVGTLLYSCIRHTFHSWGLKSSFVCGCLWNSAQWSCIWLRIIYRLFVLLFWLLNFMEKPHFPVVCIRTLQ